MYERGRGAGSPSLLHTQATTGQVSLLVPCQGNGHGVHSPLCPLTRQVWEATAEGPLELGEAEAGLECLLFSLSLFGLLHLKYFYF